MCTVKVTFFTRNTTGPNEQLKLVGNIPLLGSWIPQRGVVFEDDNDRLSVTLPYMPCGVEVFYKMVLVKQGGLTEWEEGNNRLFYCDQAESRSLVVSVLSLEHTEVTEFIEDDNDVAVVNFATERTLRQRGTLFLVGNVQCLGGWCPELGRPLSPVPSRPGNYSVQISNVPSGKTVEYKLVQIDENGENGPTRWWDEGPNRKFICEKVEGSARLVTFLADRKENILWQLEEKMFATSAATLNATAEASGFARMSLPTDMPDQEGKMFGTCAAPSDTTAEGSGFSRMSLLTDMPDQEETKSGTVDRHSEGPPLQTESEAISCSKKYEQVLNVACCMGPVLLLALVMALNTWLS